MPQFKTVPKFVVFSLLLLLRQSVVSAQTYTPVDNGSTVKFTIKNLGFNVGGSFTGIHGKITFDLKDISHSSFDVSIDAATINTDNDARDEHLRGDTYFDVKNYPTIHFVSTKCTESKDAFVLHGNLTLKKKTKEIEIRFNAAPTSEGCIFDGSFKINRKDFGVGGSSTLSDNVQVNLHIISKK